MQHCSLPAADGDIDRRLGRLAAALTREAQKLEPQNAESPSIVLETATSSGERGQIIVRRENDLNVAIEKKQGSVFNCLLSFPFGIHCNKLLHITYLKMYLFMSIYRAEHCIDSSEKAFITRNGTVEC